LAKGVKRKFHSNLSVKLVLAVAIMLAIVLGSFAYFSQRDAVLSIDSLYGEMALSVVSAVKVEITDQNGIRDREALQKTCDRIVKTGSFLSGLAIYKIETGGSERVAGSGLALLSDESNSWISVLVKNPRVVQRERRVGDKRVFEVMAPVYASDRAVAIVVAQFDLASKTNTVNQYRQSMLAYLFGSIIAILVLVYVLLRRSVLKPLKQLTENTLSVAMGSLNKRVNLDRSDELGELSLEIDSIIDAFEREHEENLKLQESLEDKQQQEGPLCNIDQLTGLENHRSFHVKLDAELNRCDRLGVPLSLIFCDLDKFKQFNEINGHAEGDGVLSEVSQIIKSSIRDYDIAARYGGEEFAIILAGTGIDEAVLVAERIRQVVESYRFGSDSGKSRKVTVSMGASTYPRDAKKKELLVAATDYALNSAKKLGGNCVIAFEQSSFVRRSEAS